jgi:anti-sigma B factor antagonist
MNVQIKVTGTKTYMTVSGRIDALGAEQLKKSLSSVLAGDSLDLTIDFAGVNFIGSSGIGKLLLFQKDFVAQGGRASIVNVNSEITMLFRDAKLDKLFNI